MYTVLIRTMTHDTTSITITGKLKIEVHTSNCNKYQRTKLENYYSHLLVGRRKRRYGRRNQSEDVAVSHENSVQEIEYPLLDKNRRMAITINERNGKIVFPLGRPPRPGHYFTHFPKTSLVYPNPPSILIVRVFAYTFLVSGYV